MDIVNSTQRAHVLRQLIPLLSDLSRELPHHVRYQRLLHVLKQVIPCDAAALLKMDGDALRPVAIDGLAIDTLGRRFKPQEHPRLARIISADGAFLFPPDCDLPDPYDGLVEMNQGLIHDCMGCAIYLENTLWGALTMDSLTVGSFSTLDLPALEAFASLAAASLSASQHFERVSHNAEDERLRAEAYRLQVSDSLTPMLFGHSSAFKKLKHDIDMVADSDLPVLITGESGVGKELAARTLHAQSSRSNRPLVSINCAALSDNLVESELFGHVRGAFSGATQDRAGKFQMADKSTLFLDEIGELPLSTQAKLLRILQNGEIQRVGSDRDHHVDVRIIAATNRNLAREVEEGRFRMDLYHRLSVFPLRFPSLRERGEDILPLAGTFAEVNRQRLALRGLRLSSDAQHALQAYSWPGNVRELEHTIARAALRARAQLNSSGVVTISAADLDIDNMPACSSDTSFIQQTPDTRKKTHNLRTAVDDFQRQEITLALVQEGNNVAAAARALELDRANLVRLINRLGIGLAGKKTKTNKDK